VIKIVANKLGGKMR